MENQIDETLARTICFCGKVFQVLRTTKVFREVEILDSYDNIVGYEEVEVDELECDQEATSVLIWKHYYDVHEKEPSE